MNSRYRRVADATDRNDGPDLPEKTLVSSILLQSRAGTCAVVGLSAVICVFLIGSAILAKALTTPDYLASKSSCACGSSASEAAANGCTFDPHGLVWLPDNCRDNELIELFGKLEKEQHHNWTFYSYESEQLLQIEDVAALAGDPYNSPGRVRTTIDWHHSHCLYTILLSSRQSSTHMAIPARYRNEKHLKHCATSLLRVISSYPGVEEPSGDSEVDVYSQ